MHRYLRIGGKTSFLKSKSLQSFELQALMYFAIKTGGEGGIQTPGTLQYT